MRIKLGQTPTKSHLKDSYEDIGGSAMTFEWIEKSGGKADELVIYGFVHADSQEKYMKFLKASEGRRKYFNFQILFEGDIDDAVWYGGNPFGVIRGFSGNFKIEYFKWLATDRRLPAFELHSKGGVKAMLDE